MKEFAFPSDVFKGGLRKDKDRQLNVPALYECVGFVCKEEGLVPFEGTTSPITDSRGVVDWPFPQLVSTSTGVYLLARNAIYSVGGGWLLTELISGLTGDGVWDVLDFGQYMAFCNGSNNVVGSHSTTWAVASTATFPLCTSACNFRGQVVICNTEKGNNWVEWSEIGSLNWTLDKKNTAGNRKVDFDGNLLRIGVLDKMVVVYGDSGIGILMPVSDPMPTFGYTDAAYYGILNRGAVGFGKDRHIFIDEYGYLRQLTSKGIEKLGYQEYMLAMAHTDINIVYDPLQDWFHISNGERAFILTKQGLTESYECVSGGYNIQGEFVGVTKDLEYSYHTIVTNPFDLKYRAQKTTQLVMVGADELDTCQVAVDWRMGTRSDFSRSPYFPVNQEGVAYPVVAGTEFRVVLRWSSDDSPELPGELVVSYKVTDKRAIRGTHVPAESSS